MVFKAVSNFGYLSAELLGLGTTELLNINQTLKNNRYDNMPFIENKEIKKKNIFKYYIEITLLFSVLLFQHFQRNISEFESSILKNPNHAQ